MKLWFRANSRTIQKTESAMPPLLAMGLDHLDGHTCDEFRRKAQHKPSRHFRFGVRQGSGRDAQICYLRRANHVGPVQADDLQKRH